MDIFLKYELYYDENGQLAFNDEFFHKRNDTLLNLFDDEKLDIRVFQRDFEKHLFDRNDNYSAAVQCLIDDIKDKKSVLSMIFKNEYLDENLSELDRNILIFKRVFIPLVMRQYRDPEAKGAYYSINYYKDHSFKFFLPIKLLAEKYKDNYESIDVFSMTTDEIIEYVLPDYYLEIGYWGEEIIKGDKEEMDSLRKEWLNEYNSVAPLVE